jgi:hypothetical protein
LGVHGDDHTRFDQPLPVSSHHSHSFVDTTPLTWYRLRRRRNLTSPPPAENNLCTNTNILLPPPTRASAHQTSNTWSAWWASTPYIASRSVNLMFVHLHAVLARSQPPSLREAALKLKTNTAQSTNTTQPRCDVSSPIQPPLPSRRITIKLF